MHWVWRPHRPRGSDDKWLVRGEMLPFLGWADKGPWSMLQLLIFYANLKKKKKRTRSYVLAFSICFCHRCSPHVPSAKSNLVTGISEVTLPSGEWKLWRLGRQKGRQRALSPSDFCHVCPCEYWQQLGCMFPVRSLASRCGKAVVSAVVVTMETALVWYLHGWGSVWSWSLNLF